MLSVKRVVFHNYCQHRDLDLEFGSGVIGIVGANGSGKSNLVKGILRGFTGDVSSSGKKEDDLSWGQESGYIELWFTVDGTDGYLKRDLKSSRCTLKFGDKEYKSYKEVAQVLYPTLGVAPRVLTDIVFVMQGQIENILFQPPSERAKALQSLFGTQNAELLREFLYDEIVNLPVTSCDDMITQLERKIELELRPPMEEAEATVKLCRARQIPADEYSELCQRVANYAAFSQKVSKLQELKNEALLSEAAAKAAESQLAELQDEMIKQQTSIDDTTSLYREAAALVKAYDTQSGNLRLKEQAIAQVNRCTPILATPLPKEPFSRECLDKLHQELAGKKTEYVQLSNLMTSLSTGLATCPTCGQSVKDLSNKANDLAKLRTDIEVLHQRALAMDAEFSKWLDAFSTRKSELAMAEEELVRAKATLASLETTKTVLQVDAEAARSFVANVDEMTKAFYTTRAQVTAFSASLPSRKKTAEIAKAQYEEVAAVAGTLMTEEQYKAAVARRQEAEANNAALGRAEGILIGLKPQMDSAVAQLRDLHEQRKQQAGLIRWRDMLERARKVLHRDELPNLVAQAYLRVINQRMVKYLELFGAKFSATIEADLSVKCIFPGAAPTTGDRLSGGQRTVLGIAFRLAVADILGNELGLLAMDEPTAALDSDSTDSLMDVVESLRTHLKNTGLQLFMVTHAQKLVGSFDQVVSLS